ncbi:hypothetical protein AB0A74_19425 [Saccharothrix sp. NPDC042600]|uniref:hypothetical protein n=1 Tax=Saccharothrix TaxID=2071 RepID=UPI00341126D1|nr:hypothetical protein GCM10017745_76520 [Saccharothrix mutabilis subsp. capreolus]
MTGKYAEGQWAGEASVRWRRRRGRGRHARERPPAETSPTWVSAVLGVILLIALVLLLLTYV